MSKKETKKLVNNTFMFHNHGKKYLQVFVFFPFFLVLNNISFFLRYHNVKNLVTFNYKLAP